MISGSLWNYYRDEINDDENETNRFRNRLNNNKRMKSKSFEYKTNLIARMPNGNNIVNAEVVVLLKYLSISRFTID